ncbi:MAG TPA: hypothetical protein ENK32_00130 [Anaerolineae bacterium]|nr:hypothetical protein [Anaerolineae bacterium]
MRLSQLLTLTTAVAGGAAALRVLSRRRAWEAQNNRMAICVDFDDAQAAAIRAGLPFAEMVARLAQNGATHLSLPEWTLQRLLAAGQLTPLAPKRPYADPAPTGHWNYLHGDAALVDQLAAEMQARLPFTQTAVLDETTLAFAGDIPTIGELGLGFDRQTADLVRQNGLDVAPRPVSYAWPDPDLLRRTLAQAAASGRYVPFAGEMILGHEMHLDATVQALADHDLTFVYFAQSRHQKGDWFIAKRRAPHVVLGHRLSPADMVPLDYHAACHNWVWFARERGIRFCYVNFFRVLHATAPLEGLEYVHHLKHALEDAGFVVDRAIDLPAPIPAPDTAELAQAGLAAAGAGAAAVANTLNLPEKIALPLTAAAAAGAFALPYLEQSRNQAAIARHAHSHDHAHDHHNHDHDHHHHDHSHDHSELAALYPPSYAPKLLALGLTTLTSVAGMTAVQQSGFFGWLSGLVYQAAGSAALAAVTSGQDYQLRIEEYKGFNLDWLAPLTAVAWQIPQKPARAGALAALAGAWLLARRQGVDVLAQVDPGHAEGHTHHISAAMAALGDMQMAVGPKPARKWTGLSPAGWAASGVLGGCGRTAESLAASALGVGGSALGLAGFRRPERALEETLRLAGPSFVVGTAVGWLLYASRLFLRGNPD